MHMQSDRSRHPVGALTLLALGPELGVRFSPVSRLNLKLAGYGGLYFGIVDAGTVRNPFFAGLVDASYLLTPALSLGLGATYKHYLEPDGPVYQGLGVNLGIQYHIGAGGGKADLKVVPTLQPIFPLFYSYYDKNPAGKLTIENQGRAPLENLKVSFFVKQYMDQPKECATLPRLAAGEQAESIELPPVQVVDMREELKAGNRSIFSRALSSDIGRALAAQEQVILFLNRRGAATFVQCRDCGHVLRCRRCDISMTYHSADEDLVCHHCNGHQKLPSACPEVTAMARRAG